MLINSPMRQLALRELPFDWCPRAGLLDLCFDSSLILLSFCSFRSWVPWTRSGNDLNRAQVLTLPDSATWRIALGQISRERTNDSGEIAPALAPVRRTDRVRATSRPPSAGRLRGDGSAASSPARVAPT